MDYNLCEALKSIELDEPKSITIEENGFIDGSFCVGSILQKKRKIVFVLHHHTFGHYQGIGTKLGYNLNNLKENLDVHVVNVMEDIGLNEENKTESWVESILDNAYIQVAEFIKKNSGEMITIVLDHPGDIGLAFGSFQLVLNYVRMFQNLAQQCPGVGLIAVTNCFQSFHPLEVLSNILQRQSDVTLLVRGLTTGSAPDISGSISIKRREFISDDAKRLTEFHYQLLDKKQKPYWSVSRGRGWIEHATATTQLPQSHHGNIEYLVGKLTPKYINGMAFLTETRVDRQNLPSANQRLVVAVRIRPLKSNEVGRVIHSVDGNVVVLEDIEVDPGDVLRQKRGGDKQFVFDHVFDEVASQASVYDVTTSALVKDVLQGFNATIFAYGPTGTGKTHTMLGTSNDPGIMVRALNDLFQQVKQDKAPETINVSMSYLEIYNENVKDLLNPKTGHLELREENKTIHVIGLTEVSTNSTEQVMQLLMKGNKSRTVEATAANKTSSRSHALLSVTVRRTVQKLGDGRLRARVRQGKLFMIDLAGSERASQTHNRGRRLVEGGHINRSLLALGNCINALSGGARYVNYRDSKLTRLLKDALSGNSHTCMIAHVSPAASQREESKNTLLYADRAKNITNKVGQNVLDISYHVSQYRTIISELRDEINRLRTKIPEKEEIVAEEITVQRSPAHIINQLPSNVRNNNALDTMLTNTDKLRGLKNEIILTFKEQMRLRRKLLNIDSYLLALRLESDRQRGIIADWEARHNRLYRHSAYNRGDYSGDTTVDRAWEEIANIEKEEEKYVKARIASEKELEDCKARALELERSLSPSINSEEGREVLTLMVRVHELEVEKMELQSERMIKLHEIRQRDLAIMRYDRQRQISEEIITRQRQIMEEGRIALPADLQALYQLYQQELHSTTQSERETIHNSAQTPKLPQINEGHFARRLRASSLDNVVGDSDDLLKTPGSEDSDWLPSPRGDRTPTPGITPASVLFPPIR